MLKCFTIYLYVFLFGNIQLFCEQRDNTLRVDSNPYISGDDFRHLAQFVFDETTPYFNPSLVKKGDIVFVRTEPSIENLKFFINILHPQITEPYILITHNGDDNVPAQFQSYLSDPKLLVWFGQNGNLVNHPKFIHIPIGFQNRHYQNKYIEIINELNQLGLNKQKEHLLSLNFDIGTNNTIRKPIYELFKDRSYCYIQGNKKSNYEYLVDVAKSKFIISPHGHGLDCHRTWEALCLNTFPVVKASTLDVLYKDLPVLIVNDWQDVTQEFLEQKYKEMIGRQYKTEKLFIKYWADLIMDYQKNYKN
ncbi:MAG: hypothetical protein P4L22_00460 [Candidatus Babeliales bacterium]|nr:hypothetical protein [Candidatus Babeliales bacterium]